MILFIPFVFLCVSFTNQVSTSPYTDGDMDYYDRILGGYNGYNPYPNCYDKCNGVEGIEEKTCIYLKEVNNAGQYPIETTQCMTECLGKNQDEDEEQCYCDLCYDGFDKCSQSENAKAACGCTRTEINIDYCECNLCPRSNHEGIRNHFEGYGPAWYRRRKNKPENEYENIHRPAPSRHRKTMRNYKISSRDDYGTPARVGIIRGPVRYSTPDKKLLPRKDYEGSARSGAAMKGVQNSTRS